MLESMDGYRGPFHANHASNYLPLKLRLPRDREQAIENFVLDVEGRRDVDHVSHRPQVGDDRRRSTATSNTRPEITRTSLPWGCLIW